MLNVSKTAELFHRSEDRSYPISVVVHLERWGADDNAASGAHGSSSVVVVVVVDTLYGMVERATRDRICSRYIRDYIAQQQACQRAQCPEQMEQRQCGNTTCGVCRKGREGRVDSHRGTRIK